MNSNHSEDIQYSVIKKYFEDTASNDEKVLVEKWLNNPEGSFKIENGLRMLWKEINPNAYDPIIDMNALLDRIHHTINLSRKEKISLLPENTKEVISFNTVLRSLARIAAILLLPLITYLGWEVFNQRMWTKSQTQIVYNEIICPLGARSQFVLPDGTKGSLNNGSRLKYPVTFQGDYRIVELHGEAYFDVQHNQRRPFIIKTKGLDVKVLGTRLNVYSYPEDGYQEFTLESGIIELIKKEKGQEISVLEMKPGQHAIYKFSKAYPEQEQFSGKPLTTDKVNSREELEEFVTKMKSGQHVVYEIDEGEVSIKYEEIDYFTSWKDGKLILRNDPMPILLKRIERWYNVKFNIMDERIKRYTYWATFEEENLDQVLYLLSLTAPIKFERKPREKLEDGSYKTQEINVKLKN